MTKASLGGQRALTMGATRGAGTAMADVMRRRGAHVSLVGLDRGWGLLVGTAQGFKTGSVRREADVAHGERSESAVGGPSFAYGGTDAGAADRNPVAAESAHAHGRTTEGHIGGLVRTGLALLPRCERNQGFPYIAVSPTPFGVEPDMTCGRGVRTASAHPVSLDTAPVRDTGNSLPSYVARRRELAHVLCATVNPDRCTAALGNA